MTILAQICLTFVLLTDLMKDERDKSSWVLEESVYVTPVITVFSVLLVWKEISNTYALRKVYPEMRNSLMGIFDWIGNVLIGLVVLVIQCVIIMKQDNRLDYVLNSVATIFIIQLDDQAVFEDQDSIQVLNNKYLTESLKDRIEEFGEMTIVNYIYIQLFSNVLISFGYT